MFLEGKTGSLEVGKYADVAVWDKDLDKASLPEIRDLRCRMTLFAGEVVYRAE
jgi:predicted amidohydrolase YtcJ